MLSSLGGADGRHIWAERYDGEMAEIFDFQDRIRAEIVEALSVQLTPSDVTLTEVRPTNNVEAYDLCLRGRSEYYRYTPKHFADAKQYFEQAIKIDPTYADAYGYLSYCLSTKYVFNWPGAEESLDHALELAEKSLALDPRSSVAHSRVGWVLGFYGKFERAMENFEQAITLDPRDAAAFYAYGETLNRSGAGTVEKAITLIEQAQRLEVIPPPGWEFGIGHSYTLSKRYEEAIGKFLWVLDRLPQLVPAHVQLVRTYSEMGRLPDAIKSVEVLRKISPEYTIQSAERMFPYADAENRQRLRDGLQEAGLPDSPPTGESDSPPPLPDKPSIAVLPFDNMSGDPEQAYFSDGIAEDIITDLSKISGLFVIARNSSFAYKNKTINVAEVCNELGVKFAVEGSVRKAGKRVRITAQLVDGTTGGHLWAERYDRVLEDIFAIQDEITRNIVDALKVELDLDEQARIGGPATTSVEAYELALMARERLLRHTREDSAEAVKFYERSIELDPDFITAHAELAVTLYSSYLNGWNNDAEATLQRGRQLAARAAELDPSDPQGHWALAYGCLWTHDLDGAVEAIEKSVAFGPNYAEAFATRGNILAYASRPIEAVDSLKTAMQLDPQHPRVWLHFLAHAHFIGGDYGEAAALLKRRIRLQPETDISRVLLASCQGHLGLDDEARTEWAEVLRINPDYSVERKARILPYKNPADWDRFMEGLGKAGIPA